MNDRALLNKRFILVYNKLIESGRIAVYSRDKEKSISGFAQKLGTEPHIIKKYLDGERYITYEQAKRLCREYEIRESFMFEDITNKFDFLPQKLGNVIHSSLQTFGGEGIMTNFDDFDRYNVHGLSGEWYSFPITGNSMSPIIQDGDWVFCQKIETISSIKEGAIYVVAIDEGVGYVKKVKRFYEHGRCTHLILNSENLVECPDPKIVDLQKVTAMFKVIRKLTDI